MSHAQYGPRGALSVGSLPCGPRDSITDVGGVTVGHATINRSDVHTGVTVVRPCEGPVLARRPVAAAHVLNGFGKTCGLVQVSELGCLETPIALTNTLCVGRVADALVTHALREAGESGLPLPTTVNPVVGETNDGRINDIRNRSIGEEDVVAAIGAAGPDFARGAVGAGRGTVCFGLKGGIGSASRLARVDERDYVVGVLVQSNFGRMPDLMVEGKPVGRRIAEELGAADRPERGSVMVVVATDAPLSSRQLGRVVRRATVGLVRCGSYMGHGSGDVFLGFTTANSMGTERGQGLVRFDCLAEEGLDPLFRACAEACEAAVLDSLMEAEPMRGLDGTIYHSLREYL